MMNWNIGPDIGTAGKTLWFHNVPNKLFLETLRKFEPILHQALGHRRRTPVSLTDHPAADY